MSWKMPSNPQNKQINWEIERQLATHKEEASQQQAELETKEQVQKLLADYQASAKEQEEQKASPSSAEPTLDRLDSLKTSRLGAQFKNILRNHSNFYAGSRVFSKKKDRLGGIVAQLVNIWPLMHYQNRPIALEPAVNIETRQPIDFKRNRVVVRPSFHWRLSRRVQSLVRIKTLSQQVQDFWVWQMSWCRLILD